MIKKLVQMIRNYVVLICDNLLRRKGGRKVLLREHHCFAANYKSESYSGLDSEARDPRFESSK